MSASARVRVVADSQVAPTDVHLSRATLRSIGLSPGHTIKLKAGQLSMEARTRPDADAILRESGGTLPTLRLHPSALTRLLLPTDGLRGHVRSDGETLHIGPFVGVFALRGRGRQPFGEHELFFRCLSAFGRPLAVPTFVFSARDIDWERRRVRGFQWVRRRGLSGWQRGFFPLPDVIYDRLATRRAEARPSIRRTRERLKQLPGAIYFNPGFFNKWFMYARLAHISEISSFLPETARLVSAGVLRQFIQTYPTLFLKPADGSLGLGIVVVRRRSTGYECVLCTRFGSVRRRYARFSSLAQRLGRVIGRGNYIVQQGIRLARWRGRRFDIRILMQKDTGGVWETTKAYARVAAPGALTSNLSGGGEAKSLIGLLRGVFGRRAARRIMRRIIEAAKLLTPIIEKQIGGTVGELGLDLGLDRRGKVWVIEVNSKPFLQMTPGSGSPRAIRLSAVRPLRWARFASGFEPTSIPTRRTRGEPFPLQDHQEVSQGHEARDSLSS